MHPQFRNCQELDCKKRKKIRKQRGPVRKYRSTIGPSLRKRPHVPQPFSRMRRGIGDRGHSPERNHPTVSRSSEAGSTEPFGLRAKGSLNLATRRSGYTGPGEIQKTKISIIFEGENLHYVGCHLFRALLNRSSEPTEQQLEQLESDWTQLAECQRAHSTVLAFAIARSIRRTMMNEPKKPAARFGQGSARGP
jgi:hypothetical protein